MYQNSEIYFHYWKENWIGCFIYNIIAKKSVNILDNDLQYIQLE